MFGAEGFPAPGRPGGYAGPTRSATAVLCTAARNTALLGRGP